MSSSDSRNIRLVGHSDLGGRGDGMHVNVKDGYAYIGHTGASRAGTSIVDVRDPANPKLVRQIDAPEGIQTTKVQIVGDVLMVNHFQRFKVLAPGEKGDFQSAGVALSFERDPRGVGGLKMYDLSKDPTNPQEISFYRFEGVGPHRPTWWKNPYAYVSGTAAGFDQDILHILDVSDPANVREVSKWWFPGQNVGAGETPHWKEEGRRYSLHHAIARGDVLYGGYWDAGLMIWDIADPSSPQLLAHLPLDPAESGATHSPLPLVGRDVMALVDEQTWETSDAPTRHIRLVDISDPRDPKVISKLPVPDGGYEERPGRTGPHNVHEGRPGSLQDGNTLYATYFNAGLRVFDVSDVANPREIAHFVPDVAEDSMVLFDDLVVMPDGLIYVTDRTNGLYILEMTGRE